MWVMVLGVVTTLAGGGSVGGVAGGSIDGTGSAALFNTPNGIAVSSSGTVYVSDFSNHLIRMISIDPCNINQVLVNGACVAVPAGFYRPANNVMNGVYYACSSGYYAPSGSSSCIACPLQTTSAIGATSCISVPTGQPTRQPTSQPSIQPSSQPTLSPSSVQPCSVGGYVASGVCSVVPAGKKKL